MAVLICLHLHVVAFSQTFTINSFKVICTGHIYLIHCAIPRTAITLNDQLDVDLQHVRMETVSSEGASSTIFTCVGAL